MNVLKWLNDYIVNEVELSPKAKSRLNPDSYFAVLAKKENRFIQTTNFAVALGYVFPDELLFFGATQIKELDSFLEPIEDYQEFCMHLQLLAKVLSDFEKAEDLENPIAKAILKAYTFMKLKLKEKFPPIYRQYRTQIGEYQEKSIDKQNVECPRCHSKEIVSNGKTKWLCNSCGRQFKKQRLGSQSRHS